MESVIGGSAVEKQAVVICIYAKEGGNAEEIIQDSFRLFLWRELQRFELEGKSNPCLPV